MQNEVLLQVSHACEGSLSRVSLARFAVTTQAIRRGLSTEGNLRLMIDWASLIVGSKFTVFALFYFVFEGNFPSTSLRGAYIRRGNLTESFLPYRFVGLIIGGAYTWRGLFWEFLKCWGSRTMQSCR